MQYDEICPQCGAVSTRYKNPLPTVDIVIYEKQQGIVLIFRKNTPHGWALPGGFVDYGETYENAAIREALEETGLHVTLTGLLGVYSDPARDPRQHTVSAVFTARPTDAGTLCAGDDAAKAQFFLPSALPTNIVFDHPRIIADFIHVHHSNAHE